ncbi:hypothetical protein B0H67DRAFT_645028 [Lasiosphaeris hirsuta]|uniref:Uncharacterized protein n=1 Tax=Lasiosphaeris hirsuta TaxID=260670 RepID=A0AA40AGA5_9PEZI|nr:hypothetical protein B0H67DRAFT_645028 [Lasiosphaeris hirsuta]
MTPPQAIFAALAGTYLLLNNTGTVNGVPYPSSFGDPAVGIIAYSAAGIFGTTKAMPTGPLRAKHAFSYAGPCRINDKFPANETQGRILHGPLTASSVLAYIGTGLGRRYTILKRDDATYLKPWMDDEGIMGEVWLKKLD